MDNKKDTNIKPKYGLFSCVGYMFGLMWKYEKKVLFATVTMIPISLLMSATELYMPSAILNSLEHDTSFSYVALVIIGFLTAQFILNLTDKILGRVKNMSAYFIKIRLTLILNKKARDMDRFLYYDPKVIEMLHRADKAAGDKDSMTSYPKYFSDMIIILLKFFLFGSVVSLLNPLIILLIAVGCVLNYIMGKWVANKNFETRDIRNKLYRKLEYFVYKLANDYKCGKDVRLYCMRDFLAEKVDGLIRSLRFENTKVEDRGIIANLVDLTVILVRDSAAYAVLIYAAISGDLDPASFLLYFQAIVQLSGVMNDIVHCWNDIHTASLAVSDFREFLDIKDVLNRSKGIELPKGPFSIEFKNVTYKYPKGEKNVLENINLKINAGEKIALVGLNGAGKTTLVRLMFGQLIPDEGEVLLDGHSIFEYNRDEMYTLFGVVPQEYNLFPVSIARNITVTSEDENIDTEKLKRCIDIAGLGERISSLPNGVDTLLNRRVNADGIDLSGGEIQKLLLARLLYRDPQCIILDEPTASLDPIAEDRLYRKYNEMTENATSVFISHRLASTRFCDRIFLLDGSRFAEEGTHESLMNLNGKYRELFDVQSKYYKEGIEGND